MSLSLTGKALADTRISAGNSEIDHRTLELCSNAAYSILSSDAIADVASETIPVDTSPTRGGGLLLNLADWHVQQMRSNPRNSVPKDAPRAAMRLRVPSKDAQLARFEERTRMLPVAFPHPHALKFSVGAPTENPYSSCCWPAASPARVGWRAYFQAHKIAVPAYGLQPPTQRLAT